MEPIPDISRREIRDRDARWVTALAVALIALGFAALLASFLATLATVLFFGALLLVAGAAQITQAMRERGENFGWDLVSGVLYAAVGGLLVLDPAAGAVGLTLLLAIFFLAAGVLRLSLARRVRRVYGTGGLLAATGVLDLVLGALIVLGWPGTAAWVIGLFLGIELVFAGVALLLVTRAVRRRSPL